MAGARKRAAGGALPSTAIALVLLAVACLVHHASAHGLMLGTRQHLAWKDTQAGWPYGPRQPEWNPHSMNRAGVCGTSQTDATRNYNNPKDVNGNPFTPPVTETYIAGRTYEFEFVITAHHYGHVELRLCKDWRAPTQACFDEHELEFVSDEIYGAPRDPANPGRGYLAPSAHIDMKVPSSPGQFASGMLFRMKFRIPASVGACEHCALQWTYVTANTCLVDGYRNYNFPDSSWWAPHLGDCPYTKNWPRDGSVFPEMFWNCADVRVLPAGSNPATAPQPQPHPPVVVVVDPTPPPPPVVVTPPPPPPPPPKPQPPQVVTPNDVPDWGRCGGLNMCGRDAPCARCMNSAQECRSDDGNKWYWQCVPKRTRPAGQATVLARDPVRDPVQPAANAVRPWGQCGGKGHDCARDAACSPCKRHPRNGRQFTCKRGNEWYWQCKP